MLLALASFLLPCHLRRLEGTAEILENASNASGTVWNLRASTPAVHEAKRFDQYTGAQANRQLTAYLFLDQKGVPLIWGAQRTEGLRRQSNAIAGL